MNLEKSREMSSDITPKIVENSIPNLDQQAEKPFATSAEEAKQKIIDCSRNMNQWSRSGSKWWFKSALNQALETGLVTIEQLASLPEIQDNVRKFVASFVEEDYLHPLSKLNDLVETGLVSKEQVASWPEVQEVVKIDLLPEVNNGFALAPGKSSFTLMVDDWVKSGFVTREQIASLPEFSDLMKRF